MEVGTACPLWKRILKIISLSSSLCLCDYWSLVCVLGGGGIPEQCWGGVERTSECNFHGKTISWETLVFRVSGGGVGLTMHVQLQQRLCGALRVLAVQLIKAVVCSGHIPQLQGPSRQDAVPGTPSCGRRGSGAWRSLEVPPILRSPPSSRPAPYLG